LLDVVTRRLEIASVKLKLKALSGGARHVRDSDLYALLLKEAPFEAMDFDLKIGARARQPTPSLRGGRQISLGKPWKLARERSPPLAGLRIAVPLRS